MTLREKNVLIIRWQHIADTCFYSMNDHYCMYLRNHLTKKGNIHCHVSPNNHGEKCAIFNYFLTCNTVNTSHQELLIYFLVAAGLAQAINYPCSCQQIHV